MSENEMKSLLSFGSSSGKSYGTVDRRYLGSNLVSTNYIKYKAKPGKNFFVIIFDYILLQDDNLTSIAVQFSTTVHQLKRTNKMYLASNEIEPGTNYNNKRILYLY